MLASGASLNLKAPPGRLLSYPARSAKPIVQPSTKPQPNHAFFGVRRLDAAFAAHSQPPSDRQLQPRLLFSAILCVKLFLEWKYEIWGLKIWGIWGNMGTKYADRRDVFRYFGEQV